MSGQNIVEDLFKLWQETATLSETKLDEEFARRTIAKAIKDNDIMRVLTHILAMKERFVQAYPKKNPFGVKLLEKNAQAMIDKYNTPLPIGVIDTLTSLWMDSAKLRGEQGSETFALIQGHVEKGYHNNTLESIQRTITGKNSRFMKENPGADHNQLLKLKVNSKAYTSKDH